MNFGDLLKNMNETRELLLELTENVQIINIKLEKHIYHQEALEGK